MMWVIIVTLIGIQFPSTTQFSTEEDCWRMVDRLENEVRLRFDNNIECQRVTE